MDLQKLLEDMTRVARQCGEMILAATKEHISAAEKTGFRDLVTKYDVQVQEFAIRELSALYPGAGFICEEGAPTTDDKARMVFVIDPIDGTANFVHHLRHSCTSIACFFDGKPALGAVYDPYADEMFSAIRGGGAFLNGLPICVSRGPLHDSVVIFGTSPYDADLADETFNRARMMFDKCRDLRRTGSAALDLCYAAAGRAGLFFESRLSLWDYAAAAIIVSEAGGTALTFEGEPLSFKVGRTSCVAGAMENVTESGIIAREK